MEGRDPIESIEGLMKSYDKAPYSFEEQDCIRFGLRKLTSEEEARYEAECAE